MDNKMCKVTNRSGGRVIYNIAEDHIRREFYNKETKEIPLSELEKLAQQPGGRKLIYNYLSIQDADAIGHLVNKGEKIFPDKANDTRIAQHVAVAGGTGYAVEMARQAKKPVYVYDQERKQWYNNTGNGWEKSDIPVLTHNFAGIGTRNINQDGINAIRQVFEKTFNSQNNITQNQYNPVQLDLFDNQDALYAKSYMKQQLDQNADLSENDKQSKLQEFDELLKKESPITQDEAVGLANKFMCERF